jgi:hypothetical protein
VTGAAARLRAFQRTADELDERINYLLAAVPLPAAPA